MTFTVSHGAKGKLLICWKPPLEVCFEHTQGYDDHLQDFTREWGGDTIYLANIKNASILKKRNETTTPLERERHRANTQIKQTF